MESPCSDWQKQSGSLFFFLYLLMEVLGHEGSDACHGASSH